MHVFQYIQQCSGASSFPSLHCPSHDARDISLITMLSHPTSCVHNHKTLFNPSTRRPIDTTQAFPFCNPPLNTHTMSDFPILFEAHSTRPTPTQQHSPSSLISALHTALSYALTYFIGITVASYFFIQACEAVSFLMESHHGVPVRLVWVLFSGFTGVVVVGLVMVMVMVVRSGVGIRGLVQSLSLK